MIGLNEIYKTYDMNWNYLTNKVEQMFGKKYVLTRDEYIILICSFINRDNRLIDTTIPIIKKLFGNDWKIIIDNLRRNKLPTKHAKLWLTNYEETEDVTTTITNIFIRGRNLVIRIFDSRTMDFWDKTFRIFKNNWENSWYGLKQLEKWLQDNVNENIKVPYGISNHKYCDVLERNLKGSWKLGIMK